EGNLWIRGNFPPHVSLAEAANLAERAREQVLASGRYPELDAVVTQVGRPDDGTDPTGFNMVQMFVPLKPQRAWTPPPGSNRRRTKSELIAELTDDLNRRFAGIDWNFSSYIRDNVMESL